MNYLKNPYDIIVVGAGYAGCEAAAACAKFGAKVFRKLQSVLIILRSCRSLGVNFLLMWKFCGLTAF